MIYEPTNLFFLTVVVDLSPEQYAHIDVMSSNIEVIENDAFGLAQIESIRLMNNQITFIGFRAFS